MLKQFHGFTLLELLTTLAIFSVLILLAIPSWQYWRQQQEINALTQQLLQTVAYARQQAILSHQLLIVCPVTSENIVEPSCGNNWENGWIIVNQHQDHILYSFKPIVSNLHLRWTNLRHTDQLQFLPNGTSEGSNGSFFYGHVQLVINRAGRTRLEKN